MFQVLKVSFQAVIIVKCICQFGIFFNTDEKIPDNDPFEPRRIIGVEKKDFYAAWDVALLMVLFFHRYVLKVCMLKHHLNGFCLIICLFRLSAFGKSPPKNKT